MKMLFYILVFIPSLLGTADASFRPEERQGVILAAPAGSRLVDATSSRNVKDRRMAHWESRSHLNFDDKDEDDAEQISYPSILEEPSPLRGLPSFPNGLRPTGTNLEATRSIPRKENTWKPEPDCKIEVPPVDSDAQMLVFTGKRHRLRLASDTTPETRRIVVRCRRKMIHDQLIQEPISVEEPSWVLIDLTLDEVENDYNPEDPFYVARGKRPSSVDYGPRQDKETKSRMFLDEADHKRSARKKREAFVESLRRYLLEGERSSVVSSSLTEQDDEGEPVSPRNKHSDIFDILREPFFISRGKKALTDESGFHPPDNGYSRARMNFQATGRVLGHLDTPRN